MGAGRLYPIILVFVVGCQQAGIGQDKPALAVKDTVGGAELDKQLEINRNALLDGTSEQIRITAASVMLLSENLLARKILLDALEQSENGAARTAVCKALIQTRGTQELKSPRNKEDFIKPLIEILTTEEDSARAKLAAEATSIFDYEQMSGPLAGIVTDVSLPPRARLNGIDALKRQPDKRVILQLIRLLDDPEKQVAVASEQALISLGIPVVGKDPEILEEIIRELEQKDTGEFLRDWLIHQDERMRELEAELGWWQKQYLAILDQVYGATTGDADKGKFLARHLASPKKVVRLWTLEKVEQLLMGTSKLPPELGPILVNLISNQDRDIRLKTAGLLSLMGYLNSAEKLLEQLTVEKDDEVKMELFVALGGACYYAFLPNSPVKISPRIRVQTLEWAAEYLASKDPKRAQKGAEVIRKLLEQDGLTTGDVSKYLGRLVGRYKEEKPKSDGALRGELLSTMAGLCAQSVYQAEAKKVFKPLFEESLGDETDLVREAAVDGLVSIDKTKALRILRKDFVKDPSIKVRERLINLAGDVGSSKEDLVWLAEKIGTAAESELAWQAILKIFKRSDVAVMAEWIGRFESAKDKGRLSDEQKLSLLEIAERKAISGNELKALKSIREKLATLYMKSGQFEQAARYLGMLRESAQSREEREVILADLLYAHLRGPNLEAAKQLVAHCLLEGDLGSDNVVVRSIDRYVTEPPVTDDPNLVLAALKEIESPEGRPMWRAQLERWTGRLGRAKEREKPEKAHK